MSACDGSGTVSRTSDAPAFQFDVMPKITTPPSTVTPTPAATLAETSKATTTTVKIENKWPAAEATAFSYQRTAEQIGAKAKTPPTQKKSEQNRTGINEISGGGNPCEKLSNKLALRKAQLKAAFFGTGNTTCQRTTRGTTNGTTYRTAYPTSKTEAGKPVQQLINQFQAMIVQQQQQQMTEGEHKALPGATASNSDEGCNVTGGGLSPYSSDNEDNGLSPRHQKPKVTRCASSDSALGLEVDDGCGMDVVMAPPQRRMTLTVTDLPLRPALLPLAEPTALPDSPLTSPTGGANSSSVGVPTKVLLEERVVVAAPGSRRESTHSSYSELGGSGLPLGVRYVRTPSVVVSDYSDDITACGISMEEMEYFRLQRARCQRRCSLEAGHGHSGHGGHGGHAGTAGMAPGCAKDEGQSDVSAASSCSNLYYCGSTISALDGGECIVNGIRVALARKSSTQSSSLSGEEEEDEEEEEEEEEHEQEDNLEDRDEEDFERGDRERERQISELLAATQLGDRRSKKVGARNDVTNQGNLKLD